MAKFETLAAFLDSIPGPTNRQKLTDLIAWIPTQFPQLELRIAWNQPMFTDHGTFIIGFSAAKNHIAVAVEDFTLEHFRETISAAGYASTKRLFQMRWDQEWSQSLLKQLIAFNITDKQGVDAFWRKA
ncbi:iron chaperone [Lacticaseibacillus brantae]|uniref:YdhG-like domain-containing protein n=1 Tax=Lacticaseibacillus brantae DSM 23927 TaxID=1423727 RepID=A0A0R2AUS4_9LACO|nr:DUF1801 domain-containing protein [Lacticaseibacillus brantae]KRM71169.1 hypothetical protein FC34_GL001860 [Lacticaseibacillus brantae DSM 23927]